VSALVIEPEQCLGVLRSEVIGDVPHAMFIHEESSRHTLDHFVTGILASKAL
jgi:hypothetical protein